MQTRMKLWLALLVALLVVVPAHAGSNAPWRQVAELTPTQPTLGGDFGMSTALDGNTLVVGSPNDTYDIGGGTVVSDGAAFVFEWDGSQWGQVAKLTPSDGLDDPVRGFLEFGTSVAIEGDTIFVGSPGKDSGAGADTGAVYVFDKPVSGWVDANEDEKLTPTSPVTFANFGQSIAVDGSQLAVGAPEQDVDGNSQAGAAYIFEDGGTWTQSQMITPDTPAEGNFFGVSVDLNAGVLIVGARQNSTFGPGRTYIFEDNITTWDQMGMLTASNGENGDLFGRSVALGDGVAFVGAPAVGTIYAFAEPETGWADSTEDAVLTGDPQGAGSSLGSALDVSGTTLAAGARAESTNALLAGAVYIFQEPETGWSGTLNDTSRVEALEVVSGDQLGQAVAINADWLAGGAPFTGDPDAGSVFIFERALPDGAPAELTAQADGTTVNLAWTDGSTNESSFRVERALAQGGPFTEVGSTAGTAYVDAGLTCETTYFYRVIAVNSEGESAPSNVASVVTGFCGLANESFEAPLNENTDWETRLSGDPGEGRFRFSGAAEGDYVFLLVGSDDTEGVRQSVPYTGSQDDSITLTLTYGGRNVSSDGIKVVLLNLFDGDTKVAGQACPFTFSGSSPASEFVCELPAAPAAYTRIEVTVGWRGVSSGFWGFDQLMISVN